MPTGGNQWVLSLDANEVGFLVEQIQSMAIVFRRIILPYPHADHLEIGKHLIHQAVICFQI